MGLHKADSRAALLIKANQSAFLFPFARSLHVDVVTACVALVLVAGRCNQVADRGLSVVDLLLNWGLARGGWPHLAEVDALLRIGVA